jgi:hypothetical protein
LRDVRERDGPVVFDQFAGRSRVGGVGDFGVAESAEGERRPFEFWGRIFRDRERFRTLNLDVLGVAETVFVGRMSSWGGDGGGGSDLLTGAELSPLKFASCFCGEIGDFSGDGGDGYAVLSGSGGREEFDVVEEGEVAAAPGRVELRLRVLAGRVPSGSGGGIGSARRIGEESVVG